MNIDGRADIMWSPGLLAQFKRAYDKARTEKADTFKFERHEFYTGYAKYLIEYLDGLFKPLDKR